MPDIADPAFAGDLGLDGTPSVSARSRAASLIVTGEPLPILKRLADRCVADQRQAARLGNIVDIDEVAALLAIFEDQRRPSFISRAAKIASTPL